MVARDPLFSICVNASCSGRSIVLRSITSNIDFLDRRSDAFAASLLLWEVRNDPNAVEGITYTGDGSSENKVKEDAEDSLATGHKADSNNIHLRVEEAGAWLHNLDSTIEGLLSKKLSALADDSGQV